MLVSVKGDLGPTSASDLTSSGFLPRLASLVNSAHELSVLVLIWVRRVLPPLTREEACFGRDVIGLFGLLQ